MEAPKPLEQLVEERATRMICDDATEYELAKARELSEQYILGRVAFHQYLDSLAEES